MSLNIKDKLQLGTLVHVHGTRDDGDYEGEAVFLSGQFSDCCVWHHNYDDLGPRPRYFSYGKSGLTSEVKEAFKKLTGREPTVRDLFSEPYYVEVSTGTGWITEIIGHYKPASGKDPYGVGPEGETAAYLARGGGLKWL